MSKVTVKFVEPDGTEHVATGDEGSTVMSAAVNAGVPGIWADCGGVCTCATCHCYTSEQWVGSLKPPSDMEAGMLTAALDPNERSRLTCQIRLTPELDGIVFHVPAEQAG
jgi:ferredoxin, 2Fe-2S